MTDETRKPFAALDPALSQRITERTIDETIFDKFSVLDPARARAQIKTFVDPKTFIHDKFDALDPIREQLKTEVAIGETVEQGGGDDPIKTTDGDDDGGDGGEDDPTVIDLHDQALTGTYTLHNNDVVETVDISGNSFTGIDIVNCPSLTTLTMDNCGPLETIRINGTALSGLFHVVATSNGGFSETIEAIDISDNAYTTAQVFGDNGTLNSMIMDNNPLTLVNMQDAPHLTTFSVEGVTTLTQAVLQDSLTFEGADLSSNKSLAIVSIQHLPQMDSLETGIGISGLDGLHQIEVIQTEVTEIDFSNNPALTTVDIGSFPNGDGTHKPAISSLDFSNNPNLDIVRVYDITTLTEVIFPAPEDFDMSIIVLHKCGLDQGAIDDVLAYCDDNGGNNGFLMLTGMGPPSAAGLVSKASLQGKGWTVTVDS